MDEAAGAKLSYIEGHVTRVDSTGVEILDSTEHRQFLHYPQAEIRFQFGQVLHVRVRKDDNGQLSIDAIV